MRSVLLTTFLACSCVGALAQNPSLPGSEVRVEKLFDARLQDAKRVEIKPILPSLDTSRINQQYEVVPVESDIAYEAPKIRPLAVKVDAPPTPYRGFARLGAGLPAAYIGDLGYVTRNDYMALRADLHSYGFKGNFNEDQRYSEFNGNLGGTYYLDQGIAVDLDFDYDRRNYRYYGFEQARRRPTDSLSDDLMKQHFGNFAVGVGIRNSKETAAGIDYSAKIKANFLEDNFASKERNTQLAGSARKDFGEQWYAEVDLDLDFTTFDGIGKQNLNVYQFKPTVGTHYDKLGLRLGINISNENDEFAFYPNVEASYAINPSLVIVAGATGGPRKQNFSNLTNYLPYLISNPDLRIAQEWKFFGAVQGRSHGIDYKGSFSFSKINDLALFASDVVQVYKFRPLYDTANVITLRAEANAPIGARLSGGLQLENRIFDLKAAKDPYLLPSFDAQFNVRYEVLEDKFGVTGLIIAQNSLPVLRPAGVSEDPETKALVDVSVHADYRFSERFGAFAQANNLLNNRRRKFPYYPILGTNILVGLTARF